MRLFPALLLVLLTVARVLAESPAVKWEPAANPWDRGLGTHRVILKTGDLPPGTKAVAARMEWRRPDNAPEKKAVLVHDLKSGKPVANVAVQQVTNEAGEIVFEPTAGAGEYAVYFLPVKIEGGAFPVSKYLSPQKTADDGWLKQSEAAADKPRAEVVRWEAISAHDAWTKMEVIATDDEVKEMMTCWGESQGGVAVILPPREQSVRMADRLSTVLVHYGSAPKAPLGGHARPGVNFEARPGERLIFQVVLWSPQRDLKDVRVKFTIQPAAGELELDPAGIHCLTTDRVDWNGVSSKTKVDVPRGKVVPLWFEMKVPDKSGRGSLNVGIEGSGLEQHGHAGSILSVEVSGLPLPDSGDADPQSLSRLRWLNSTTAVDEEPVKGYTPLTVSGRTIRCLGRELELGEDGLPVQIRSYFNKAVTKVMEKPTVEMLRVPLVFEVWTAGQPSLRPGSKEQPESKLEWKHEPQSFRFTAQKPGTVEWESIWTHEKARLTLNGHMEFDGSVRCRMALEVIQKPVEFAGALLMLMPGDTSLFMGLQQESGLDPMAKLMQQQSGSDAESLEWKWDTANKHQDSFWTGTVNAGLRLQLKSDNYVRPSVNIHYKRRPLNDPPSWNAGRAGVIHRVGSHGGGGGIGFVAKSGPFLLEPGKPLHFDFDLLITPFHTLRTKEQWSERYYHTGGVPQDYNKYLDNAKTAGANVVNIHQGNGLNPYINYPFLTWEKLRDFSKAAHDRGIRAKYYYTVRELSNWCPELFAFRSMGDEILMSGKGGGHPWGEEHLGGNYWQAWFEPGTQDVSFLTQPMSRFHNYYIEGLRWLCENAGCDGIYLDDIAYDRSIMLRARKVLDRYCPRGGLIDLHSWNEFHDGGAWAHCANIFMDSMPFVDRLWFGEGHHYSGPPPEHFLVEISGIPFGLMGEMLEGGGNPWLGLVHGCTGRLGWGGSPQSVWKLWDEFGVQDAEFIGWWAGDECPVRCADPLVKATVWKKADATLVAVANFSKEAKPASLTIDWASLGRDPARAKLYFPPVASPLKQKASLTTSDKPLLLKPYSGAVFFLDEKPHDVAAPAAAEALGQIIIEEDFTRDLDKSWKPVLSTHVKDGARLDAGYVLQVPANVHAYLERPLPVEAAAVSARIWQDGKDQAQQWGPGLAVIWPDGKALRVNIRSDGRLTVSANGGENLDAASSARAPIEFTIRWDKDTVKIIAAGPGMGDLAEEIAAFPRSSFPSQPSLMRTGKMPNSAGAHDHGDPGPSGFNRIEWVRVFGSK